jgi:hypothetical protein
VADFFDVEVDGAVAVVWVPPDFAFDVALPLDAGWVGVALVVAAPAPATVTIWAGGLLALVLLPERPISTPTPIASTSVAMMAISVLLTAMLGRRGGRPAMGVFRARRSDSPINGTRAGPRRCPHSTQ